jgi:poly-beta-hydroxyalkanoate depolymerase
LRSQCLANAANIVALALDGEELARASTRRAAPMSGHFATLLRGTAQMLLADHDVYTDRLRGAQSWRCWHEGCMRAE